MEPLFSMPQLPDLDRRWVSRPPESGGARPPPGRGFRDRRDAGRQLARALVEFTGRPDVLVLAMQRDGVPVAFEAARALGVPLDAFLVRKLGAPGHEEFTLSAIASGGGILLDEDVVRDLRIPPEAVDRMETIAPEESEWCARARGGGGPEPNLRGRTVILIDDGSATAAGMRVTVAALRQTRPARIVVAVPMASPERCTELQQEADAVVCARTPEPFYAFGLWYLWYHDPTPTSEEQVRDLLANSTSRAPIDHQDR